MFVFTSWRLRSLAAVLILVTIATPILPRASASTPTSLLPAATYTSIDWMNWASTAWAYYAPGVGVNSGSGLHRANLAWGCFADWDLGSYIYATIYARKLNLISDGSGSGDWQFNDRINKILNWLQNRPLASGGWPYSQYTWDTGQPCWGAGSTGPTNAADSGRLLAALNALRNFRSSYATTGGAIIARSQSAYDTMGAWSLSGDYYGYLAAEGFADWGYSESNNFNKIDSYSGSYVPSGYGQNLPRIGTVAEPIDHILLESDWSAHQPSSNFIGFTSLAMQAQQGRYTSTGLLTAWSEGDYPPSSNCPSYIYELIVDVDNQGNYLGTWRLKAGTTAYDPSTCPPLAYTKVAFAYLALYGENAYTLALVNAAKNLATSSYGFGEATYENGQSAIGAWGNRLGFYSDKTNEFILAAAYHAQQSQPQVLTTGVDGGSGSVSPSCPSPSGCSETVGQSATVTATPSSGWQFSGWSTMSGVFCSTATCTFNMPASPVTLRATFTQPTFVSDMRAFVTGAGAGTVSFVLPDYTGPNHSPAAKCGGVNAAQLSDYSAGGYVLGLLSNPQNQLLDNSPSISMGTCGSPTGLTGTIVTLAGPGVNTVAHYYEQVAGITPVYYLWDGSKNNLVARATGQRYYVPNAGGNTVPGDDLFLIEAFGDALGRHVFVLYGFSWQGTLAAGVFFASYVYPQLTQFPNAWYIYRWTDASSGTSANMFPDPGDTYALVASSGSAPSLSSTSVPPSGTAYSGFAGIGKDVFGASQGSVYFILPDYSGPYHTSSAKCGGRNAASLSDYSAGGYILSADSNFQSQVLDTGGLVSSASGSCGQFLGSTSTAIVTVAGPGVNTALYYYEQVSATTPVYYFWDGARNNFVVRSTGVHYTVSAGNTGPGDDLFLLESFVDGQGRHVYVIYGFSWEGTLAGATYLSTHVRSHLSSFTNSWYIYEWKDAASGSSANSFPDSGDQFNQLATG